jgi:hypothetical protein
MIHARAMVYRPPVPEEFMGSQKFMSTLYASAWGELFSNVRVDIDRGFVVYNPDLRHARDTLVDFGELLDFCDGRFPIPHKRVLEYIPRILRLRNRVAGWILDGRLRKHAMGTPPIATFPVRWVYSAICAGADAPLWRDNLQIKHLLAIKGASAPCGRQRTSRP